MKCSMYLLKAEGVKTRETFGRRDILAPTVIPLLHPALWSQTPDRCRRWVVSFLRDEAPHASRQLDELRRGVPRPRDGVDPRFHWRGAADPVHSLRPPGPRGLHGASEGAVRAGGDRGGRAHR